MFGEREVLLLGTRDLLESGEVGEVVDRCVDQVLTQVDAHITRTFTAATLDITRYTGRSILDIHMVY